MKRFATSAEAVTEQIHTLANRIDNLRLTRDLLQPRLLSGQVTIPE